MTPGAWRKQGFTYKLADGSEAAAEPNPEAVRRQHLEKLRTALWHFAATHNGRFPNADEVTAIPRELWEVPDGGGLRYLYRTGLTAGHAPDPLAWEPELDAGERFVLRVNGDVLTMRWADLRTALKEGGRP
jgi:hypothetical protein